MSARFSWLRYRSHRLDHRPGCYQHRGAVSIGSILSDYFEGFNLNGQRNSRRYWKPEGSRSRTTIDGNRPTASCAGDESTTWLWQHRPYRQWLRAGAHRLGQPVEMLFPRLPQFHRSKLCASCTRLVKAIHTFEQLLCMMMNTQLNLIAHVESCYFSMFGR